MTVVVKRHLPPTERRGAPVSVDQIDDGFEKSPRSVLGKVDPNGIRPLDVGRRFGLKRFGSFGAPVEIEFAVDDLENVRVYAGSLAGGRKTSRSVSAVLRCKPLRIGGKQIPVVGAGEMPFGVIPTVGKRAVAFHCAALGVIGHWIIAFDGHPEESGVNLIEAHGGSC